MGERETEGRSSVVMIETEVELGEAREYDAELVDRCGGPPAFALAASVRLDSFDGRSEDGVEEGQTALPTVSCHARDRKHHAPCHWRS